MIIRRKPLRKRFNSDDAGFYQRRASVRFSQIRDEVRALSNIACILREDVFFQEAIQRIDSNLATEQLVSERKESMDTSLPSHQVVRSLELH